jgi:hypothetical protein
LSADKTAESGAGKFLSDGEEIIVAHVKMSAEQTIMNDREF